MFRRTTTVSILSDKHEDDEFGDPVDKYEIERSGIPAHIGQKRRTYIDPRSGRPVTIRHYVALLPAMTKLSNANRVKDEKSGTIYLVDHVQEPRISTGAVPTHVEMRTME